MRYAFLFASLCLIAHPSASAQEVQTEVAQEVQTEVAQDVQTEVVETRSPVGAPQASEIYTVQLTEYSTQSPLDPKLTASEIVERLSNSEGDDAIQPVETIRLSALSGQEAMVQFGRSVALATGTASDGRGAPRQVTQRHEIGTLVRVTATPQGEKVFVKLMYEASRVAGEGTENSPLDITRAQITTNVLVEIGKPTLIGGFSGGESSFFLFTVGLPEDEDTASPQSAAGR